MGIFDSLFGSSGRNEQVSTLNPQQNQLLQQLIQQVQGGYSSNPLESAGQNDLMSILSNDPRAFDDYERPYKQQFEQEVVPGIAERFSSQFGGQGSSAFRNSLLQAGKDLTTSLASQRAQLKSGARDQLFNMLNNQRSQALGTRSFENVYRPATNGLFGSALNAFSSGIGGGLAGSLFR